MGVDQKRPLWIGVCGILLTAIYVYVSTKRTREEVPSFVFIDDQEHEYDSFLRRLITVRNEDQTQTTKPIQITLIHTDSEESTCTFEGKSVGCSNLGNMDFVDKLEEKDDKIEIEVKSNTVTDMILVDTAAMDSEALTNRNTYPVFILGNAMYGRDSIVNTFLSNSTLSEKAMGFLPAAEVTPQKLERVSNQFSELETYLLPPVPTLQTGGKRFMEGLSYITKMLNFQRLIRPKASKRITDGSLMHTILNLEPFSSILKCKTSECTPYKKELLNDIKNLKNDILFEREDEDALFDDPSTQNNFLDVGYEFATKELELLNPKPIKIGSNYYLIVIIGTILCSAVYSSMSKSGPRSQSMYFIWNSETRNQIVMAIDAIVKDILISGHAYDILSHARWFHKSVHTLDILFAQTEFNPLSLESTQIARACVCSTASVFDISKLRDALARKIDQTSEKIADYISANCSSQSKTAVDFLAEWTSDLQHAKEPFSRDPRFLQLVVFLMSMELQENTLTQDSKVNFSSSVIAARKMFEMHPLIDSSLQNHTNTIDKCVLLAVVQRKLTKARELLKPILYSK